MRKSLYPSYMDPGLWMLLAMNVYIIIYVHYHPSAIHTVIALFWLQSVFIGIFNALHLFTLNMGTGTARGEGIKDKPGCMGFFFLVHYGGFHLVYLIFLLIKLVDLKELDWSFLRIAFWLLLASGILEFIKNKVSMKNAEINGISLLFMPYIRIVPMHLLLLVPAFFNVSATTLFLVMKTLADLIMYVIYRRSLFRTGAG